ncbi:MAG: DNA repair protein RecO [Ideonella sp.]|nr:DNA repair protein RecO [Ideonella sp.]
MPSARRGPRSSRPMAAPDEAYVLHHHDWSESSLILDVFTRERGRVVVAAKGAKRPYSQLRSVLLPFQRLHLSLGRPARSDDPSASEVQTLRTAEWAGGPVLVAGHALFPAYYLNELLIRLLPRHDPHPALFDAYVDALGALAAAGTADASAPLRAFELRLLRGLGLLPELAVETPSQQPVVATSAYDLKPDIGVVAAAVAGPSSLSGSTLQALEAALAAGDRALDAGCAREPAALKAALQGWLHYHLGSSALRSRDVLRSLRHLQPADAAPPTSPAKGPSP